MLPADVSTGGQWRRSEAEALQATWLNGGGLFPVPDGTLYSAMRVFWMLMLNLQHTHPSQ